MWCQATIGQLTAELEAKTLQCEQLAAMLHDCRQDREAPGAQDGASGAVQFYGLSGPDEDSYLKKQAVLS